MGQDLLHAKAVPCTSGERSKSLVRSFGLTEPTIRIKLVGLGIYALVVMHMKDWYED